MNPIVPIITVAVSGCVLAKDVFADTSGKATPPNIVFLMADDHGCGAASCYGSQTTQTPNIDRLARDGVKFTRAFANNSICSPSRAVLLTGKYNHLCGVERLQPKPNFDGSQQTFPKLLQAAGYETALVGKWHLGSEPTGFDYYCATCSGSHRNPRLSIKGEGPWKGDNAGKSHPGFGDDVLREKAIDWLKSRTGNKPFCLMLHFVEPHSPHYYAPRFKDMFKDTVFPEPESLCDDYAGRAPEQVAGALSWSRLLQQDEPQYQPIKKGFTGDRVHDTRLMYQAYMRNYLRMVAGLDDNVGRMLDYLAQSGLDKNTIVIYTSDNGYFNGEHGFYNKMWMYDPGCHIPMIIRMPGVQKGSVSDRLVSILDIAPTILDLAGVPVPADIQGQSMRPLLAGGSETCRKLFYYHYYCVPAYDYGHDNAKVNWIWSPGGEIIGIRTETTKLVCYPKWKNGPFWEYFNLASDPNEMKNLVNESGRRQEIADMKQQLLDLARHYKDTEAVNFLLTTQSPK